MFKNVINVLFVSVLTLSYFFAIIFTKDNELIDCDTSYCLYKLYVCNV